MDQITAILTAAVSALKWATNLVNQFVTKNTPESALLAAIAVAYQQWQFGSLSGTQFAIAAVGALIAFSVAEANKDKSTAV